MGVRWSGSRVEVIIIDRPGTAFVTLMTRADRGMWTLGKEGPTLGGLQSKARRAQLARLQRRLEEASAGAG